MKMAIVLAGDVGAYFFYGIFAENIGQLFRNKKISGMTIRNQFRFLWLEAKHSFRHKG
ncbi:hypothetical protein [Enterococcus canis]|uniref:hypothetical protein n=2 Tax=Enterococcus canis TaxID=214095 RepID=UPI000A966B40|nr:hypothetical protein [Enterococcus canis]